jgi:alkanesulfonate monooxygenase SsuD/methylene tetrahydromethanopterin reductase-like flavin-dependent oxidoreductase (luciferase family)
LLDLWAGARETRESGAGLGPAPARDPHPRLLVGGYVDAAIDRAVKFGDGFIFGAPPVSLMAARIPLIREAARSAAGIERFPVEGLAYVLPSEDPEDLADGERLFVRYYGPLQKPFRERVNVGTPEQVAGALRAYEEAGVDVLHLIPVSRSIATVERLAADVLPAFATPGA